MPRLLADFYLDAGTAEVQEKVQLREDVLQVVSQLDGVRRFHRILVLKGYFVKYIEFKGGPDFEEWRRTLLETLTWASVRLQAGIQSG